MRLFHISNITVIRQLNSTAFLRKLISY